VSVTNGNETPVEAVQVNVTGNSYALGALEPGERASVRVSSTGESLVELRHAGIRDPLVVDTYLEPGYSGEIEIRIEADSLKVLKNEIRMY
jgi:hypothetical protein